ncbi:hypothetical protein BLL36_19100 [Pseudomonas cedrina subsp. cedrina]|uniref:Uncharacterized protein n=1 Tax=Pseudomonas cedrina subsp. cedrina TaxID=76762 RepID=A0A1V2K391_PSECE|nr:hypothetical protein BLL36_19100 [Pseudomonas cedrina subsp. cedrina]
MKCRRDGGLRAGMEIQGLGESRKNGGLLPPTASIGLETDKDQLWELACLRLRSVMLLICD